MLTCNKHPDATVIDTMQDQTIQHIHMSCGCTLETAIVLTVGDAVISGGMLYRVIKVVGDTAYIKNDEDQKLVDVETVTKIGRDTLSKMYMKDIPDALIVGDFVTNSVTGISGIITDIEGFRVRVTAIDPLVVSGKKYIWHVKMLSKVHDSSKDEFCNCFDEPHHQSCPLFAGARTFSSRPSRYFPNATPKHNSSSYSRMSQLRSSFTDDLNDVAIRKERNARTPIPYTPHDTNFRTSRDKVDSISMADLIKDEIKESEKKAQQGGNSEDTNPTDTIPKRKSEW